MGKYKYFEVDICYLCWRDIKEITVVGAKSERKIVMKGNIRKNRGITDPIGLLMENCSDLTFGEA